MPKGDMSFMGKIKKVLVGDREFYSKLFAVAVPMIIQMGITNLASLLDNLMVGKVGTEEMTGVSIANTLIFVFNLMIFGALSGAGIFTAQFYGQGNHEGVRHTVRFKYWSVLLICAIGATVFLLFGETLIQRYLTGEENANIDPVLVTKYGRQYLNLILLQFLPFAIVQVYSSTMKETGQTVVPMVGGILSVFVNLILNYVLIYGKFGAPALGVRGAAIGTIASRVAEMLVVVGWAHLHPEKNQFVKRLYRHFFRVPGDLVKKILIKGFPLFLNEFLWSLGVSVLTYCYSLRGSDVVTAMNISNTLNNLFSVFFLAIGNSVGILVGHLLGAGKLEEAKLTAYRIVAFSSMLCVVIGGALAATSGLFPQMYNTYPEIRALASKFIVVLGCFMPMNAYLHATYFTIRSGGKTLVTFLFDCCFMWVVTIPVAYVLAKFTALPIVPLYAVCTGIDLIKCTIGTVLMAKGMWLNNIVNR